MPTGGPAPYGTPPGGRGGRGGLIIGLVAGGLVLVVGVAVTAFLLFRKDDGGGRSATLPGGVTVTMDTGGTVTMAASGVSRPVVDVYEDFQCPPCKTVHDTNDTTLRSLAGERKAKVVYHPMVIFSAEPMASSSTRAAAAARCAPDGVRWLAYQDQLFAHQPAESSNGYPIADLVSYGGDAGITSSDFASCVRGQRYASDVRTWSRTAIQGGITGTPTVMVNNTKLTTSDMLSADGLRRAVEAAG
ncbi:thioredoxin domain-containing protein [Actinoallomurus sp. NPDC050550]|uniref:DsbA family protein n=1 Tax=Actinoallomurus sp. NPDC050550 TaxID=3154937 RepID=UPI0033E53E7B